MKKNRVGMALRVAAIVIIIAGTLSSILPVFSGIGMPGYMGGMLVTYNLSDVVSGILISVVIGLVIGGFSEVIFILDENRENTRRMCRRFGVNPAVYDRYADAKKAMEQARRQNAGNQQMQNMNGMNNGGNMINPQQVSGNDTAEQGHTEETEQNR